MVTKQRNGTKSILRARLASLAASAKQALRTAVARKFPGRASIPPVGADVQLAERGKYIGTYRATGHPARNLIAEWGRRLHRWPKQMRRPISTQDDDSSDSAERPDIFGDDDGETQSSFAHDPIYTQIRMIANLVAPAPARRAIRETLMTSIGRAISTRCK